MDQATKVNTSAQPLRTSLCPVFPLFSLNGVRITKTALKIDHILTILGYGLVNRAPSFLIGFIGDHLKHLP